MKVALALFVKNEANNIAHWVAWHLSLGFDRLYIYDDNSSDGTYDILESCSNLYDIVLTRTKHITEETNFFFRQRDCFFDAAKKATGNFSWIGFLDGDEYLSLEKDNDVKSFFRDFDNFSGIALNWKIYGSSDRVLKTKIPVYQAYNHHSTKDLNDNTLVKSFVRPEKLAYSYSDPHKFVLDNGVYADSLGQEVNWNGSCKNIEWSRAWVNHYICRSLEDYIGRIQRRAGADLADSNVYWNHFNKNDIFHNENNNQIKKANFILNNIKEKCVKDYISQIRLQEKVPLESNSAQKVTTSTYKIKSFFGAFLSLDRQGGFVIQDFGNHHTDNLLKLIIFNNDRFGYIIMKNNQFLENIPFYIKENGERNFCYKFELQKRQEGDRFYLKSMKNNRYLCCLPHEQSGYLECNRKTASDWESFSLEIEENENENFNIFPNEITNLDDFYCLLLENSNTLNYNDFLLLTFNLNEYDMNKLKLINGGLRISWLF